MRTFFCIPIGSDTAASIGRVSGAVHDRLDLRATWVRPANYHVTLRFLGEIDPLLTLDLERLSRRIAEPIEPFALQLDRLGCFPSVGRARILWFGGDAPAQLRGIAASLDHELQKLGFPSDRRLSVAHVTLARIKAKPDPKLFHVLDEQESCPLPAIAVHADRIVLMESTLSSEGPTYTPLFTTTFRKAIRNGD